ncbi:MAG: hypothetical protein E7580_00620 [Ruminococcaceae bacterium]|nr:hypothetical protein [Oscillospiraceae bacterium]
MFNLDVCLLTVQKVAFLLTVIFIGYLMRRSGKVEHKAAQVLSILTTHIFSPCYTLKTLPKNFTVDKLGSNLTVLALSCVLLLITVFLSRFLAKKLGRTDFETRSLCYVFAFANTGYFGYPVIEGVFGEAMLSQFMIFCIPFNITLYSYGYGLFMSAGKKINWKKILLSPVMLSYYLGIVMGLSGIAAKGFLADAVSGLGACMSPASMLSAGIVLGGFGAKKLLTGIRPYAYSLIRLVAIPALFGIPLFLAVYFGNINSVYLVLPMAALAMPVGLNTVVYPESFGYDASDNAKLCFVSFVMSILTLPIVFSLVSAV